VIIGDSQTVVTQPTAGTFKAFTSVCTHQQCQVANVEGGTINCTCHGSKFDISDGSVVRAPASQPLAAKPIKVSGDSIQLA
jgi:Rieske Fe-S protein